MPEHLRTNDQNQAVEPTDSPVHHDESTQGLFAREDGGRLLSPENFAQYVQFPHGYPNTIVEIGVARGGTTAMSQVLACSPTFDAYGEDILRNAVAYKRNQGLEPDTIQMPGEGSDVVLKETYGPATESMVSHYPVRVLQLAAQRAGISESEFARKTQVLAVTRDPLAIYTGWLKYWTITRDPSSIEEAHEKYGHLSLINLIEAYNCLAETVLNSKDHGLKTTVVVSGMFENPPDGIPGMVRDISQKLGIDYTDDMVMFQDPNKEQKKDIYPVTHDSKYHGLHEDIDNRGFRYFPPNYRYADEILPALKAAGLVDQYKLLHRIAETDFGKIDLPGYIEE